MKKHYETHVEDTDKLISVAGSVLDYKSWYEQYRKLMEEQAQRKYGLYTPTSEGDDDDFPSIPGMIARYSASGLTNEQMKENPVWVDKTGNGHDLQMKNFLWGGMSGVGGYKLNWGDSSIWANYITQGALSTGEVTDNTIHITSAKTNNALFETRVSLKSVEYKVLIKGLTDDIYLRYGVFNDGKELWTEIKNDGIYTLPSYDCDSRYNMKWKVMSQTYPIDCDITIEQLPIYPGFILGDGVDDFAVTEKELNFEDTYTVYTAFIPFQVDPIRAMEMCGKDFKKDFYLYYSSTHLVYYTSGLNGFIPVHINQFHIIVCKRDKTNAVIKNLITGESKTFSVSELINNPGVYYLWKYQRTGISTAKTAIAGQTICNGYFSTDEDDEKVLDWYKKQYPWLFPDQAWTVTGKTNEGEDRATIANITGNGNDLILSNFGFIEGSGYNEEGEYAGYLVTDGVDDKAVSKQFKLGENFTVILDFKFPVKKISYCGFDLSAKVRIQNLQDSGVYVVLKGNKTLIPSNVVRAVTSEGKVYDENWNEYNIVPGNISSNYTMVNLGFDGSNQFAESATKLAGIYSSTLSKDDCIKAYNYLQTLKAK